MLVIFAFFFGTRGTWQVADFDFRNLLNMSAYTIVPYPPATPPLNETPPDTIPPSDDGIGGPYGGYDTCGAWATALGKDHVSIGPTSISDCEAFAYYHCEAEGKTLLYFDWAAPNCCIWKCTDVAPASDCAATCSGFHRYSAGCSDQTVCNTIAINGCGASGVVNAMWKPTNCCCYDCSGDWG